MLGDANRFVQNGKKVCKLNTYFRKPDVKEVSAQTQCTLAVFPVGVIHHLAHHNALKCAHMEANFLCEGQETKQSLATKVVPCRRGCGNPVTRGGKCQRCSSSNHARRKDIRSESKCPLWHPWWAKNLFRCLCYEHLNFVWHGKCALTQCSCRIGPYPCDKAISRFCLQVLAAMNSSWRLFFTSPLYTLSRKSCQMNELLVKQVCFVSVKAECPLPSRPLRDTVTWQKGGGSQPSKAGGVPARRQRQRRRRRRRGSARPPRLRRARPKKSHRKQVFQKWLADFWKQVLSVNVKVGRHTSSHAISSCLG